MKLEVGMYVRTDKGNICKIIDYHNDITDYFYGCYETDLKESLNKNYLIEENILKASHNIIDLIEVGDYVNGTIVTTTTPNKYIELDYGENRRGCYEEDIKSIVTKEQFESMSYNL